MKPMLLYSVYIYICLKHYMHIYIQVYANGCQTVRVVTHIFNMGWGGVGWGC